MGYWVDIDDAYWTMDAGLHRDASGGRSSRSTTRACSSRTTGSRRTARAAAPACPTTSSPRATRPSSTRRSTSGSRSPRARCAGPAPALLVWTTTPWTLVSNTAVRGQPDVTYVVARTARRRGPRRRRAAARARCSARTATVARDGARAATWSGTPYARPFDLRRRSRDRRAAALRRARRLRHHRGRHRPRAPGPRVRRRRPRGCAGAYGLPVVNPMRPDGTSSADVPLVGGMFFKKADATLVDDLQRARPAVPARRRTSTATRTAGAATRRSSTTRSRPGTSAPPRSRTRCSRENEATNWYPETIKWGRYGDWLHNNIDWALSRNRYWGTPLPIWRCERRTHLTCASGRWPSSASSPGSDLSALDPHRPFVDDVTFACPACGGTRAAGCPRSSTRWFDSRRRCRSRSGATRTRGVEDVRGGATPPTSSARRSTRPAAGSTR